MFLGWEAGGSVKSGIIPSAKGTTKVGLIFFNKISRISARAVPTSVGGGVLYLVQ